MTVEITRKPRSSSMPSHAVNKIPQACHFYKKYGKCKWGSFCRFQHRILYMEKPTIHRPLNIDGVQMQENQFQEVWDHKAKL